MKQATPFIASLLLGSTIVTACGPSQAELDAQATEIAADIFGTQTAAAPTPTFTPTSTPRPTSTPVPTPTPRPLSDAALTIDDLPAGFLEADPADFGLDTGSLAYFVSLDPAAESRIEGGFAYSLETEEAFEIVAGATALFPTRLAEAQFAANIPLMLEGFLFGVALVGGSTDTMEVDELPEIVVGDESGGVTTVVDLGGLPLRFDVALFRRDRLAAVIFTVYIDGDVPAISLSEVSQRLDERMIEVLELE
jgi:hypothetical protein